MLKAYQDSQPTIYCGDCLEGMRELPDGSIDCVVTDPPYGLSFMGKDWDKAVPSVDIWRECLRVLKPGAFAFVMCIPRQDCLSRMIVNLGDAGFETGFTSIYWAYASGFPKAQNIGKAVDKRLGAEREVIGIKPDPRYLSPRTNSPAPMDRVAGKEGGHGISHPAAQLTTPSTPQAKALDGSYAGWQPKPAVEIILVCMRPLSEKTYVDQALKNQKGITWLDDGRIPTGDNFERGGFRERMRGYVGIKSDEMIPAQPSNPLGRFPANLLVSDDVLDDGRVSKSPSTYKRNASGFNRTAYGDGMGQGAGVDSLNYGDSGSFSRYFDLDQWAQKTFPFLITPKASKAEKNRGLSTIDPTQTNDGRNKLPDNAFQRGQTYRHNSHPTCKPIKLMAYLITLGSREGDTILDPFMGSGSTLVAAKMLNRKSIGFEIDEGYCEIATKRCEAVIPQTVMELSC